MDYRERITIDPGKRSGKPCIRGLRITVYEAVLRARHADVLAFDADPAAALLVLPRAT